MDISTKQALEIYEALGITNNETDPPVLGSRVWPIIDFPNTSQKVEYEFELNKPLLDGFGEDVKLHDGLWIFFDTVNQYNYFKSVLRDYSYAKRLKPTVYYGNWTNSSFFARCRVIVAYTF